MEYESPVPPGPSRIKTRGAFVKLSLFIVKISRDQKLSQIVSFLFLASVAEDRFVLKRIQLSETRYVIEKHCKNSSYQKNLYSNKHICLLLIIYLS